MLEQSVNLMPEQADEQTEQLVLPPFVVENVDRAGVRFQIAVDKSRFSYGTDALLLADGIPYQRHKKVCDIGSGNGVLTLMALAAHPRLTVDALEIDAVQAALLRHSLHMNGFAPRAKVLVGDAVTTCHALARQSYDAVICNPPYFEAEWGKHRDAKSQSTLGFDGVAAVCEALLKFGGTLYTMCPARRMFAYHEALQKRGLAVKRLELVAGRAGKKPYLALLTAKRGAKADAEVMPVRILDGGTDT